MRIGWSALGLSLLLVLSTGCDYGERIEALELELKQTRDWLGRSPESIDKEPTSVHKWHGFVDSGLCNLETVVTAIGKKFSPPIDLPEAQSYCHLGAEHTLPPRPPPFN
jgi:hypothetical protein